MRCPHRNNDERNGVSNDDQQKTLISNFMNDGISPLPIHIAKIVICGKCKTSNRNLERSLKWTEGLFTICVCIIRLSFFTHIVNVIKVLLLYLFPLACPAAYLSISRSVIHTVNSQRTSVLAIRVGYCSYCIRADIVTEIQRHESCRHSDECSIFTSTISFIRQCSEFRMCNGIIV